MEGAITVTIVSSFNSPSILAIRPSSSAIERPDRTTNLSVPANDSKSPHQRGQPSPSPIQSTKINHEISIFVIAVPGMEARQEGARQESLGGGGGTQVVGQRQEMKLEDIGRECPELLSHILTWYLRAIRPTPRDPTLPGTRPIRIQVYVNVLGITYSNYDTLLFDAQGFKGQARRCARC
jgi:hypothetical protein